MKHCIKVIKEYEKFIVGEYAITHYCSSETSRILEVPEINQGFELKKSKEKKRVQFCYWDLSFVKAQSDLLIDIVLAANFLVSILTITIYNTSSDPKKGALDFKNPKLKKYSNNLIQLNWINSSNSFLIRINLFCSSLYHSFWEIKILKSVNKVFFGPK